MAPLLRVHHTLYRQRFHNVGSRCSETGSAKSIERSVLFFRFLEAPLCCALYSTPAHAHCRADSTRSGRARAEPS